MISASLPRTYQIRGRIERERIEDGQVERVMFRSWSVYREDGVLGDLDCPAGRIYIQLEAPGHGPVEVSMDLDPKEAGRELTIPLPASTEPEGED